MYKINGNDIDVYAVIRGPYGNDIILRNYTKDEVKCLGHFKNEMRAINERDRIKRIFEFLGFETVISRKV